MRRTLLCILLLIFSQSAYSQMTMRELTVDNQKIKVLTTLDKYGYEITEPKFEMIGEKPSISFQITAKKPLSYRIVLGEYSNGGFVLTNTTSKLIRLVSTKPTQIYLTLDRGSIESIAIGILQTTDKIPSNSNRVQASKIASKTKMATPSNAGGKDDKNAENDSVNSDSKKDEIPESEPSKRIPLQVNGIESVIAEGSGESANEAVKDALRNAIMKIVGTVVDAETLVKDDQVINDKVLTYSDGFIKTYEEVSGSKSVLAGIHRIKIKALVEKRSVVEKLKSSNVAMKEVDGKGMFAELITKQSGESNATELLRKALAELPTLLEVKIAGKAEYDRTKSEVVVMVEVTPDVKAYQAFVKRLEETLKKVAISKDSVVLKAVNQKTRNSITFGQVVDGPDEFLVVQDASSLGGPKRPKTKPGDQVWALWVCSFTSGKNKSQTWNGYVLPGDPKKCFIPLLMPEANARNSGNELVGMGGGGIGGGGMGGSDNVTAKPSSRLNNSKTNLRLILLDNEGKTVTEDLRELTVEYIENSSGGNRRPLMRAVVFQKSGDIDGFVSTSEDTYISISDFLDQKKLGFNGMIAPFFFQPKNYNYGQNSILLCSTKRMVEFRIKVTEEELKRFDAAKVEISFSE